MTQVVYDSRQK